MPEWGVTILQADEEMDAGDVWKSCNFAVPHSSTLTKSAFYNKVQTHRLYCGRPHKEYMDFYVLPFKVSVRYRG